LIALEPESYLGDFSSRLHKEIPEKKFEHSPFTQLFSEPIALLSGWLRGQSFHWRMFLPGLSGPSASRESNHDKTGKLLAIIRE
jgi:hypothetical protein